MKPEDRVRAVHICTRGSEGDMGVEVFADSQWIRIATENYFKAPKMVSSIGRCILDAVNESKKGLDNGKD